MNQALEQFIWDLQIFAEGEAAETTGETTGQEAEVATQEDNTPQEAQPETPQETPQETPKSYAEMSQDEQLDFIKQNFLEDEKPKKEEPKEEHVQAEEPQTAPTEEPTFEVTIDGEKKQVTQSELINGYQRQADYTRKTQALADERRQVDAMLAALKLQEQTAPKQDKPQTNPLDDEMQAAVARAERDLGIKPGEFNQFDPRHNFALQRAIADAHLYQMTLQREQQQVQAEVQAFAQEVQKDPMAKQISDSFRQYILKMGMESPESGLKAQAVAMAMARYDAGQMTLADTKLLKEHWNYVKGELTKAQKPAQAVQKPIVQPPKTETPGTRSSSNMPHVLDKNKLRSLSRDPDGQLNYLKSLGIFG